MAIKLTRNKMKILKTLALLLCCVYTYGQVGIGTTTPDLSSILDVTSTNKGILTPRISLSNTSLATPVTTPATGLLVYNTNATVVDGDGTGFYYWDSTQWVKLNSKNITAENGLYLATNDAVRLGGVLIENTTVTQDSYNIDFNLNSTGDFAIQDNGVDRFKVYDDGRVEMPWTNDASGTTNTGVLEIGNSLRIDGNEIITNTSTPLYLQNDNNGDLIVDNPTLIVDADIDVVRCGSATGSLMANGTTINLWRTGTTITVDYVADFDHGTVDGSTLGLGSIEYLVDGSNELFISDDLSPDANLLNDLGWENYWDDVYADEYWIPSDVRLKDNIKTIDYGLNEILNLDAITYTLKDDPFKDQKLGLKAQQILELIPESVKTHDYKQLDESKPGVYTKVELDRYAVNYQSLVPVLVKAIQEQQLQIETLKKKVKNLN